MWHSYIFRKWSSFWPSGPLSCQNMHSKIQKIWRWNEALYRQEISPHIYWWNLKKWPCWIYCRPWWRREVLSQPTKWSKPCSNMKISGCLNMIDNTFHTEVKILIHWMSWLALWIEVTYFSPWAVFKTAAFGVGVTMSGTDSNVVHWRCTFKLSLDYLLWSNNECHQ